MSRNWPALALVLMAAAMFPPLSGGAAHATGCDTNPADVSSVSWSSGRSLAPNGSLANSTSAAATVTAYNGSGVCVQGAQVSMHLRAVPAGGSVTSSTTGCPSGTVGPNVSICTTDGNGAIPIWYTTPATLPNDGTDYVDAWLSSTTAVQTTSYTYGSIHATGSQVSATEGRAFSGAVAVAQIYNFATVPNVGAVINWGDGTSSAANVTGPAPGSPGPAPGSSASLTISGAHTYLEESANGPSIQVTLGAPSTATVVLNASATVTDAPITATAAPARTVKRRTASTFTLASFTDGDPGGVVADFTAAINWGDGTHAAGSISATPSGFTVTATHSYATTGTWSPVITTTDNGGATGRATTTINVTSSGH